MSHGRVLLMTLSERTSAKGNAYLSGFLGKARVVAFRGESDRHGNPTWDVYVSEPEPRDGYGDAGAPAASGEPAERRPAQPASYSAQRRRAPPVRPGAAADAIRAQAPPEPELNDPIPF